MKEKRVPVLATTTKISIEDARATASALIEQRLAACVQIVEPITSIHPYDVPELIATAVVAGSTAYLDWLEANVIPAGE